MGNFKRIFIGAVLAFAAVGFAGSATRKGASVLHYMTRTPLAQDVAGSNVTATARLQLNEQGRSLVQKLNLDATGLAPSTMYFLTALIGDDPNPVIVKTVTSDKKGRLHLAYMKKGQGNGNSRKALPDELDPVTDIRGLALQTVPDAHTVVYSPIDTSPTFQYMVKRNLTAEDMTSTAAGSIDLKATASKVSFKLRADGLSVSNVYFLALNVTNVEEMATADKHGRLEIKHWPASAPATLDLRTLSLLDSGMNVVLGTTLPK